MAVDSRELRLSPLVVIAVAPIDPVRNFLFLYQYCRMLIKKLTIIKEEIFYIEDVVTLNMGNIGVYEGGRNSSVDSSAPTILRSRVRIKSTTSMLSLYIVEVCLLYLALS